MTATLLEHEGCNSVLLPDGCNDISLVGSESVLEPRTTVKNLVSQRGKKR
jgi:hypothetical protein